MLARENGNPSPEKEDVSKIMTHIENTLNDPSIKILHYNTDSAEAAKLLAETDYKIATHPIFISSGDGYRFILYRNPLGQKGITTIKIDRGVDPENKSALLDTIRKMLFGTILKEPIQIEFTSEPIIPKNPAHSEWLKTLEALLLNTNTSLAAESKEL